MNDYYASSSARYSSSNSLTTTADNEEIRASQMAPYGEASYSNAVNLQQFDGFGFGNYHVVNQLGSSLSADELPGGCNVNQMSYSTSASMSSLESYSSSGTSSLVSVGSNGKSPQLF